MNLENDQNENEIQSKLDLFGNYNKDDDEEESEEEGEKERKEEEEDDDDEDEVIHPIDIDTNNPRWDLFLNQKEKNIQNFPIFDKRKDQNEDKGQMEVRNQVVTHISLTLTTSLLRYNSLFSLRKHWDRDYNRAICVIQRLVPSVCQIIHPTASEVLYQSGQQIAQLIIYELVYLWLLRKRIALNINQMDQCSIGQKHNPTNIKICTQLTRELDAGICECLLSLMRIGEGNIEEQKQESSDKISRLVNGFYVNGRIPV
ncbi:MAG: hypothetical protein EZS28_009925 [Streblomastix strix]|uniref:Uncharacterized protein n=1 Tax=Streblomastix strix TaxID=222440 RepID=A0A5J4WI95_9EUKA|nr:MAG: hypothetical protein EZS28_009925 [Streblomastix strix]